MRALRHTQDMFVNKHQKSKSMMQQSMKVTETKWQQILQKKNEVDLLRS